MNISHLDRNALRLISSKASTTGVIVATSHPAQEATS
jgi:hypothetical protein